MAKSLSHIYIYKQTKNILACFDFLSCLAFLQKKKNIKISIACILEFYNKFIKLIEVWLTLKGL